MGSLRSIKTQVNGIEMRYLDSGVGQPLLLLHGFSGCARNWEHVFDLAALAERWRLIAPDLRGHGGSDNPAKEFTHRQCSSDVLALLDELGLARVRAIGLSLGANTLLHMTTRAPERVDAMVIVAATTHYPEAARAIMRAMGSAEHSAEEWRVMREQHRNGDEQIRSLWRHMVEFANDREDMAFGPDELRRVRARTLIVNGDRDPLYGLEPSLALYRDIPDAALWIIPDGGHGPIFERWRSVFAERALEFLERADPRAALSSP